MADYLTGIHELQLIFTTELHDNHIFKGLEGTGKEVYLACFRVLGIYQN